MKKQIQLDLIFIRFAYWLGAVMDFLVALSMTLYVFFQVNIGMNYPEPTNELRFMLSAGMALMWGWTILLVWGDRKPIKRRLILLFTAFPVVLLLFINELVLFLQGYSNQTVTQFAVFQSIRSLLFIIFIIAFILAVRRNYKKINEEPEN